MTEPRTEPSIDERQEDAPDSAVPTADPADKTQPAEGGREESEESFGRPSGDDPDAEPGTGV
jgi:hypothetical protein